MGANREQWEYGSLEQIAEKFESPSVEAVSFDVFDTLLVRPVERAEDVFGLLDRYFGQMTSVQTDFRELRVEAEAVLRRRILAGEIGAEDISIDDIYAVLEEEFGIAGDVAAAMKRLEFETEIKLCRPRESGRRLFERALRTGKPVLILSDMYLKKEQIRFLLEKNGYRGMASVLVSSDIGKRKITGNLYREAARRTKTDAAGILHIGDHVEADCRAAVMAGCQAAWLPKSLDIYDRYGCGHQVEKICADLTDWEAARTSVGIGSMRALAAEKYFDDPFRPFERTSDYNADPYFVGYGALGMELLALIRWLADNLRRDRAEKILFLSRDGFLPMKVYERYREDHPELPPAEYLRVSRLAMLPVMVRDPADLFRLPLDVSYHTPRGLLGLLAFCARETEAEAGGRIFGFLPDEPFTRDRYQKFIKEFLRSGYDREKHLRAMARVSEYLLHNEEAPVTDDAALFDMGYSGRVAEAILRAAGRHPKVYYFHADARGHFHYEKRADMKIRAFFDFSPYMESSLREYSYLEPAASCVAYGEDLKPVYDAGPAEGYADTVLKMQKGALDFVGDFQRFFAEFEQEAAFRCHDAAMPMEAFLRYCTPFDRKMYENVLIDDDLWGGRRDINLRELMEIRLRKLPDYAKEKTDGTSKR